MNIVHGHILFDADGAEWNSKSLTASTTYYSTGFNSNHSNGYAALLVKTDASITISFQLSNDDITYYTPVNTNGTDVSKIYTALAADAYIIFSPQIAKFMRIKVVCNSNATTTITYIHQEVI